MRRLVLIMAAALVIGGCSVVQVPNGPPVPPGPLGPIVQSDGGNAQIECRGVPIEQCRGFANDAEADVVRYIVTCTSACTPEKGDVRVDILGSNGTTRSAGAGSYSSAQAVPAPDPVASESSTT